jgi:hypothetical protein
MISTGINGLDEMVGGGIPKNGRVLYSLDPGVDGRLFMISALSSALAQGTSCLVILPHTTVEAFGNDAARMHGTGLDSAPKQPVFLDTIDRERIQKLGPSQEARKREWVRRIQKVCRENQVEVIFAYFDLLYEDFGLETGLEILESARNSGASTYILELLNFDGAPLLERFVRDFSFDLVLRARSSLHPLPQFTYFTLVHTSWSPNYCRSVPFSISEGRVVPYVPKILVTGPPGSGKSTFVTSACRNEGEEDTGVTCRNGKDQEIDFCWLRWNDFDITIYGTPGHTASDPLVPPSFKRAMGVVLVIDATRPGLLSSARQLIEKVTVHLTPLVIAANKSDLPGSMDEQEIRKSLGIPADIPVFAISAIRKPDVRFVLESLVDSITQVS